MKNPLSIADKLEQAYNLIYEVADEIEQLNKEYGPFKGFSHRFFDEVPDELRREFKNGINTHFHLLRVEFKGTQHEKRTNVLRNLIKQLIEQKDGKN